MISIISIYFYKFHGTNRIYETYQTCLASTKQIRHRFHWQQDHLHFHVVFHFPLFRMDFDMKSLPQEAQVPHNFLPNGPSQQVQLSLWERENHVFKQLLSRIIVILEGKYIIDVFFEMPQWKLSGKSLSGCWSMLGQLWLETNCWVRRTNLSRCSTSSVSKQIREYSLAALHCEVTLLRVPWIEGTTTCQLPFITRCSVPSLGDSLDRI